MNHRLLLVALVLGATACPPAATLPSGCGKDTDCKGSRICIANNCVEPPQKPVPVPMPVPMPDLGDTDGGPVVAEAPTDGGAPARWEPPEGSPMFHGDPAHTGRSRYRAPTSAPKEVMHVATVGVVHSSPALAPDGTILFGSHDRNLYAANPDGTLKWRRPTGDLVWAAPAVQNGVAYFGSDDDRLYALDLEDGRVRWQFQAGPCRFSVGTGPEGARCDVDGVTLAPDGTLYVSADGLYALRPDGQLKWKFEPGRTHCAAAPALGPDGTVFVGCHDDALYAVDVNGQKRWDFRAGDDIDSPPTVGPDGVVYFGSDDRKLYAIGPGGALRWAVATGGPVRSGPALGKDGTVYVGSFDGSLYAVRSNGAVAWTFRTADRILSSPIVDAAGTILFGSEDDRLYALSPEGKLLWSVLLDGDVDSTPVLGPDGTIYVGCDDKALHGLR